MFTDISALFRLKGVEMLGTWGKEHDKERAKFNFLPSTYNLKEQIKKG
jgi:hypothetical protein